MQEENLIFFDEERRIISITTRFKSIVYFYFEYSKENGYEFFNLGLVPLAEVGESKYSFIREKIAYQIFINGNFIYSFKGLKKFKDKYASDWNEKYIAYKKESSLVITCIQILKLLSQEKDTSDKN